MTTKTQTSEAVEAQARLREMLPPGSTLTTVLNHVSRSGMSRAISPVVNGEEGPEDITWLVVRAFPAEFKFDQRHGGIKMGGCGMDMGFALVYALSRRLYSEGFACIGDSDQPRHRCPSNDHSNGDRDYAPHLHRDGGYAINHRWL